MRLGAALVVCVLVLPAGSALAQGGVRAPRVQAAIRLDGVPDEAVWLTADSITDFRQREPGEGVPASERTVVRFLRTAHGLYVGLWAYDSEPHRIVRSILRRDADPGPDDYFAIVLDPQRDRRTGLVFAVNANGAMADAEIRGPESRNMDWNGVWDARARVGDEGWTAEVFIPWQTLRYRGDGEPWGINVLRFIRRKNEEVLWRSWRRQQGLFYLEEAGALVGLSDLPPRRLVELRPFATAQGVQANRSFTASGADSITEAARAEGDLGLDAKLALAPTLTLDVTVNTDFAQSEVDRQIVNLSRFPLFFPEKRSFFLEAGEVFEFGHRERTLPFYSRRIGLAPDGTPNPIIAGARLTGRVGRERIGLLAVRTGNPEDAFDVVARVKHDVLRRGYVGFLATGQGGPGVVGERHSFGVDAELPTLLNDQNLVFGGFAGTAWNGTTRGTAWRVVVDYPNDWADLFASLSRVGEGYDPALGFVRETGVWRTDAALRYYPRPGWAGVRRLQFTPLRAHVSTDLDGSLQTGRFVVSPFGVEFDSGDEISMSLSREMDVPTDSFDIFRGAVVPPGRHAWNRFEVDLESSESRPLAAQLRGSFGGFFTGHATELDVEVTVRAAPHLIAALEGNWQRVSLAGASFTARTARLRLDVASSARLATTMFLQWDNESERLAVNARLHWIIRPGSDVYLVWNSAWPTGLDRGVPWRRPLGGALVGKLVYYFRL